jgi:hypothetical protein
MKNISVFANFYINDEERLNKLKLSFKSFNETNISNWVINLRGNKKEDAKIFLIKNIKKDKLKIFFLESEFGWNHDSLTISKYLKSKLIFFWIEDHVCIGGYKYFNKIIKLMHKYKIEYLPYSWFFFGNNKKSFVPLKCVVKKDIIYTQYTKKKHNIRLKYIQDNRIVSDIYIISCCSIINKKLFIKLLSLKDKFFLKWNIKLPFNFEKTENDNHWLPYKIAILKKELFASLDDDLGLKGYSLISRNLYKNLNLKAKNTIITKQNFTNNNYINYIKNLVKNFVNLMSIKVFLIFK